MEAGEITFTVSQFGSGDNAFKTFNITSNSKSSNILTDNAYRFLGGQEAQSKHWETFFQNLQKNIGANIVPPIETTEKSETPIPENKTPVIKQAGT